HALFSGGIFGEFHPEQRLRAVDSLAAGAISGAPARHRAVAAVRQPGAALPGRGVRRPRGFGPTLALDCALILILAAALVWPLFQAGYLRNWGSIESTFIADARFLTEHWPHPRWQPLWYCGTRF